MIVRYRSRMLPAKMQVDRGRGGGERTKLLGLQTRVKVRVGGGIEGFDGIVKDN